MTKWAGQARVPIVGRFGFMTGLSLIEMLIALLVVSVGLLGMAGLQAYSLRMNTSAYYRSQANTLAYEILDAMRTNRESAKTGGYNITFSANGAGTGQAAKDLAGWLGTLRLVLPSGDGQIACGNAALEGVCSVTVAWDDTRSVTGGDCGSKPGACQQLTVSTRL